MAVALWLAPSAVSETAGVGAIGLLAAAFLDEANTSETAAFVTFIVVGLAWAALAWTPLLTVPTLGLALGLGTALYTGGVAAFYGQQPEEAIGIAVLVVLAAGGLAGYVRDGRWPLAAAAVVALAMLVFRLTNDSLGAPVALLLTGLVLLGSGAVVLLRRRNDQQG
jgi:LPXTG-motif cell wall-anchored protein